MPDITDSAFGAIIINKELNVPLIFKVHVQSLVTIMLQSVMSLNNFESAFESPT